MINMKRLLQATLAFSLSTMVNACSNESNTADSRGRSHAGSEIQSQQESVRSGAELTRSARLDGRTEMIELMKRASKRVAQAYATTDNVYVSAVSFAVKNAGSAATTCTFVQIQQRNPQVSTLETLTPESQAPNCKVAVTSKIAIGSGSVGFAAKVFGNNFLGGVGVAVIGSDGSAIGGCGAGVVGYASEIAAEAGGTAGLVCGSVVF